MLRRLRELGVVESKGVAGTGLRPEYAALLKSIELCTSESCIGFNICRGIDPCSSLSNVLRIRDSLVSVGVDPRLILCCENGLVAPGAPSSIIEEYAAGCRKCIGRRLCIVLDSASTINAAKSLYAAGRVLCG